MKGKMNGRGTMTLHDCEHTGFWKHNLLEGEGKIICKDGNNYDGKF